MLQTRYNGLKSLKICNNKMAVISFPHQSSDFYLGAFMIVASMGSVRQTTLVTVIVAGLAKIAVLIAAAMDTVTVHKALEFVIVVKVECDL